MSALHRIAPPPEDEFDDISARIQAAQAREQARKDLTRKMQAMVAQELAQRASGVAPAPILTLVPKAKPKPPRAPSIPKTNGRKNLCGCGAPKKIDAMQCRACYKAERKRQAEAAAGVKPARREARRGPVVPFRVERALKMAERLTGLTPDEILSVKRNRYHTRPRYMVMAALRAHGMSYPQIGRHLGRDHSSVYYAVEQAHLIASRDAAYATKLDRLIAATSAEGMGR